MRLPERLLPPLALAPLLDEVERLRGDALLRAEVLLRADVLLREDELLRDDVLLRDDALVPDDALLREDELLRVTQMGLGLLGDECAGRPNLALHGGDRLAGGLADDVGDRGLQR